VRQAAGKSVAGRWSRFAAPEERTTSTVAKILFLNIPASGHVNPTLAVARELIGRGDRVCYALPESWRETIENAGAEFAPLAETLRSARSGHGQNLSHDARIALMPYAMAREAPRIAPELERLVQAEKPDCIVFNELDLPAKLAVRLTGVPAAAFRTFHGRVARARDAGWATGPVANYMTAADQTFASFLGARGLAAQTVAEFCSQVHDPTIVFVAEAFQVDRASFDQRFVFVGPSLAAAPPLPSDIPVRPQARRVLISLGTLRNDEPEFYRLCFDAFGAENWQAFLSIGKTVDPVVLGAPPENFVVRPHLPQTSLLQVVDVFVTHAGLNSVMESLYYGAPMIMVPGTREQKLTAERAEQLGLGFRADLHDLSANALRDLASRAVDDVSIPPVIAEIRKSMQATVGYARAADVIQRVAGIRQLPGLRPARRQSIHASERQTCRSWPAR